MCSSWNADGGNLWQAVPKICSSLFDGGGGGGGGGLRFCKSADDISSMANN